jgi:hypothetical protein
VNCVFRIDNSNRGHQLLQLKIGLEAFQYMSRRNPSRVDHMWMAMQIAKIISMPKVSHGIHNIIQMEEFMR